MLGEEEVSTDDIPNILDMVLQSSLWQRRLNRQNAETKALFDIVLAQRAKYIWNTTTALQRKGYFLAGVGLETGQYLDAISQQANILLINANLYIGNNNQELAITSVIQLARLIFDIVPFTPRNLPDEWEDILAIWLKGETLTDSDISDINGALQFIEDGLVYRLPWGLEAIRVRAQANEDIISDGITIDDYETGLLVPAIENGTLNRSTALLMQAGFNSRKSAIQAVSSTNATFANGRQLSEWLNSDVVSDLTTEDNWPTPETSSLWLKFISEYKPVTETTWASTSILVPVNWFQNYNPLPNSPVKLFNYETGETQIIGSSGEKIGQLQVRYDLLKTGIYYTVIAENVNYLNVVFWGAGNNSFKVIEEF